ncbi:MAG: putative selenate reductase subunit YgfK [Sphaerochaetaceae bacterium]
MDRTVWKGRLHHLKHLVNTIRPHICRSVTISTMHGCPPDEIEAICSYMLTERALDTVVKLNPTLLGQQAITTMLTTQGYGYISLKAASFANDLHYQDAVPMLKRLQLQAIQKGKTFGVKLTNTLGTTNTLGFLNAEEIYMSGRALFPISLTLAQKLAADFGGAINISYSGGINELNIKEVFETGIRPITVATDVLKPGGYVRLAQMARQLAHVVAPEGIDVQKLTELAQKSRTSGLYTKAFRGEETVSVPSELPLIDCYIAPCVVACPIHQNIPDYIYLVGQGRYSEALELIYQENPLPHLTGYICDHQCQYHCTRLDYEGTVHIREMKKIAAEMGFAEYVKTWEKPTKSAVKAAVIGSGPAGLAAAYFLARNQIDVTVFEKEQDAGGIAKRIIPGFRFPSEALQADIDFIAMHGVQFVFNAQEVEVEKLQALGFSFLFYAIGAEKSNHLALAGPTERVHSSLEFLASFRQDPLNLRLGDTVAVVGGGNTAIDSARAALRVRGVKEVHLLYRRGASQMPADKEEVKHALEEGVQFHFLTNPHALDNQGNLECQIMRLGEADASNRPRPIPTGQTTTFTIDTLISAIGEQVDSDHLKSLGIKNKKGVYLIGDAATGPSSIALCIASAFEAVQTALHDSEWRQLLWQTTEEKETFFSAIRAKRGKLLLPLSPADGIDAFGQQEASRCLQCNYICDKCVEVCPNRANVAIDVRRYSDLFDNPFQIIHLDALCNECGNCTTFCPYLGSPYRNKLTLFSTKEDFDSSKNNGFFVLATHIVLRLGSLVEQHPIDTNAQMLSIKEPQLRALIGEVILNHSYLLGKVEM